MSVLRKIQRVGKRASKFQYSATYQSVVVECQKDSWTPNEICVAWSRRGRRFITQTRKWQSSPENKSRGVVIWPEPEIMEITVTLYKGPKDKSYETKEWEFSVIDVDAAGKRKVLGTTAINMVRYASTLPYEHDVHLRLKAVSRKIKSVILEVSLSSMFLKEGKATDDDMMSIASQMSVSNLSTIGFLEDEDDDFMWHGGRSITPPTVPDSVLSTDGLLKWAQVVTKDYRGVKISNMTTSWRNGLGFLAIIHYHRPDLLDFDMVSPNSVKENNRLAFETARNLGIFCPLTPNMMLTSTVPDKLSVTSFVYQMNQYFTKATISAISRDSDLSSSKTQSPSGNKASPFDLSAFDRFTFDKLSPVISPQPTAAKILGQSVYSRHSRNNSLCDNNGVPLSPIQNEDSSSKTGEGTNLQSTPKVLVQDESAADATEQSVPSQTPTHKHPSMLKVRAGVNQRPQSAPASPRRLRSPPLENGNVEDTKAPPSKTDDRALEFENLGESEESEDATTVSSCSLDTSSSVGLLPQAEEKPREGQSNDRENGRVSLPAEGEEWGTTTATTNDENQPSTRPDITSPEHGGPGSRRKLPTIPGNQSQSTVDKTQEDRRKKAREMLKKAHVSPVGPALPKSLDPSPPSGKHSSKEKFREQAKLMIYKALQGNDDSPSHEKQPEVTPTPSTKCVDTGLLDRELASEGSSTSINEKEEELEVSTPTSQEKQLHEDRTTEATDRRRGSEGSLGKNKPSISDGVRHASVGHRPASAGNVRRRQQPTIPGKSHPLHTVTSPQPHITSQNKNMPRKTSLEETKRRNSDGNIDRTTNLQTEHPHHASLSQSQRPSSGSASKQKKPRSVKTLPVAKPVASSPSLAARRLAQQKQIRHEEGCQPDSDEGELGEPKPQEAATDGGDLRREDGPASPTGSLPVAGPSMDESVTREQSYETTAHAKVLESPSAWSQHNEDLSQDLLVTQSEYVKEELTQLQQQLQRLEERASNIEADIRNVMSTGNKEEEEQLMQEWFGILNRKNELIKRQIELNVVEKEEDLEKRQYFLNRELRPLMDLTEEQKTVEQKEREAHLIKELLEIIDERDQLERRKMCVERDAENERMGFAYAQAKAAELVQTQGSSSDHPRQGGKDCVIS